MKPKTITVKYMDSSDKAAPNYKHFKMGESLMVKLKNSKMVVGTVGKIYNVPGYSSDADLIAIWFQAGHSLRYIFPSGQKG